MIRPDRVETKDEQTVAKGFFKGVTWGAGVSVGALVLISVADGNAVGVRDETATSVSASQAQVGGLASSDGSSAVGLVAPDVPAPEPDTLAGLLSETISSAAVPEAGSASDLNGAEAPADEALTGIATPSAAAPQVTYTDTGSLRTPDTEAGVSITTEPAQPVAPDPVPQTSAFAEPEQPKTPDAQDEPKETVSTVQPDTSGSQQPENSDQTPNVALDPTQPAAPAIEAETSGFDSPSLSEDAQTESAEPDQAQVAALAPTVEETRTLSVATDSPEQPKAQQITSGAVPPAGPESEAPDTADALDMPVPETPAQATKEGESSSAQVEAELSVAAPQTDATEEGAGAIVTQVTEAAPDPQVTADLPNLSADGLSVAPEVVEPGAAPVVVQPEENDRSAAVRVNRLPSLGATLPEEEEPALEEIALEPENDNTLELKPIEKFAAEFENPENKPVMAVILVDDGVDLSDAPAGLSAVQQLPYPVSFAVDALLPDAADRMRAYREAGFEVLAMVDLPEGAQAADAEVNLSVALEAMPEVVGVLDGVRTGVQTTPDAGRQVAQILAQTGHGFVTQNRGLNTVQKLAARQGVPSAVIFRDFDAKGQSSAVIRRFLDQAAFRAGQEGAVIMLGRLREETLAALVVWTLQDRASSVAMAPVSDALTLGQ